MATGRNFKYLRGRANGYRSGLEERLDEQLKAAGIDAKYEGGKLEYTSPPQKHTYTWDFQLPNGIIIESKGWLQIEDRKKHLLIKAQHPELDIRFVFQRSAAPIYKGSPTTYAKWCEKNGFLYADKEIPAAWLKEKKKGK
ncbi:hypothetical protein NB640_12285 [Oxalobacter vibrioformis]|uniref:Endonuclease I n=1 Tax=Oxalobacter vibrioformis TaxID=933080 RepID=A0A9E9LW79_9BURK|nr:hypothetical protein [Oxalobacter vibrioformis]WAW09979.1 hypothetical protein NB640_12285 [Oxalobacter vibrioformis]